MLNIRYKRFQLSTAYRYDHHLPKHRPKGILHHRIVIVSMRPWVVYKAHQLLLSELIRRFY